MADMMIFIINLVCALWVFNIIHHLGNTVCSFIVTRNICVLFHNNCVPLQCILHYHIMFRINYGHTLIYLYMVTDKQQCLKFIKFLSYIFHLKNPHYSESHHYSKFCILQLVKNKNKQSIQKTKCQNATRL